MIVEFVHNNHEVIGRIITGWFLISAIASVLLVIRLNNRRD